MQNVRETDSEMKEKLRQKAVGETGEKMVSRQNKDRFTYGGPSSN